MKENFQDGKNPQDKGDSVRHGIPKKSSISALKKIRSSSTASKRKKQLAHWQINMRKGKTNEDAAAVKVLVAASGALNELEMLEYIDMNDIAGRANKITGAYRAPGA